MKNVHKAQMITIMLAVTAAVMADEPIEGKGIYAICRPSYDAELSFPVPGTVAEIHVKEGDKVEKGDLLVSLDTKVENARLEQLKAEADSKIQIDAAKARLEQAKSDLEKISKAAEGGAASEREVEHARLDVKINELSLQLAGFEHEQNRRKYREVKQQIERMKLKSDVRGLVESIHVEIGEAVTTQENRIARIVVIDPLRIDSPVPVALAEKLKPGGKATVTITGRNVRLKGNIVHVSRIAEAASNTVRVRIEVPNPQGHKAGQQVRVTFP